MNATYTAPQKPVTDSVGNRLGIVSPDYPTLSKFQRGKTFLFIYASVIAILAVAFVGLAFLVKQDATQSFDIRIANWIQNTNPPALIGWLTGSPIYSWVLTNLSALGDAPWSYVTYAVVFLGLFGLGLRLEASVALAGSAASALVGMLLRSFIDRARPTGYFLHISQHVSGAGFPSGHVMMYVTLFGFAFYIVLIAWRWNVLKAVTLAVLALLVILIGLSRVYLGAHWPTDTTGAYLVGWLFVAGMIELHRIALHRFVSFRTTSVPAAPEQRAQPLIPA